MAGTVITTREEHALRRGGQPSGLPARVIVTKGQDGNAGSGSDGTARVEHGRPAAGSPEHCPRQQP